MSGAHEQSVIPISSTSMKFVDIEPIHVAAAMETAMTMDIRIIEATTGLSALLFCLMLSKQDPRIDSWFFVVTQILNRL